MRRARQRRKAVERHAGSWDHLPAHREIQLARGDEIGANQIQIVQLNAPVILLRVQKIKQRRSAILVREGNGIADPHRLLEVSRLVGAEQRQTVGERRVGGIDVAEYLDLAGGAQLLGAANIELRAEL